MAVFDSLRRRLLASLLRVGGDASPARPRSADSLLASMHRYLRSDLPVHARLYEAFQRLPGHERAILVEQLESMTQGDSASASGEVAEMRSHGRGCFFSQEGEDLILSDLFPADHHGFYVDVGAHHPYRFSNTAYFFLRGWSGINIDAAPGTAASFARARPNDVTVECAVGLTEGEMDFFLFDEPALNTLEPDRARQLELETNYRVKEVRRLPVRRLDAILSEHLPRGRGIDFLSIDVEGHELAVVHSNDWQRYRPTYVLLELLGRGMLDLAEDPVVQEMRKVDYEPFVKGTRTVFFRDTKA